MALAQILANKFTRAKPRGFVSPANSSPYRNVDTDEQITLVLQLDVLANESFEMSSSVTKSQVEDGSTISDHVTPSPDKLTIEAIVSDTPVSLQRTYSKARFLSLPSQDAHKILRQLANDRKPFDFVGGLQVYKNMVITSYNPVRNSKTGSILHFVCSMEQVKIVSTQTFIPEKVKSTSQKRATVKVERGTQTTSPIPSGTFQNISPTQGFGTAQPDFVPTALPNIPLSGI